MDLLTKQFHITGMTCINCQNRIEQRLATLPGIEKVSVSYQTGIAKVKYHQNQLTYEQIAQSIAELGYEILPENKKEQTDIAGAISFLAIIIALYALLQHFELLNMLVPNQLADSSMGYGMLFVVGLFTSVHCIAMCGGINLSQCLPTNKTSNNKQPQKFFLPALLYNFGRVISYTAVGFLLGFIGLLLGGDSGTGISVLLQGILKLLAGALMVIMGINMLGIFPWLRKLSFRMPTCITQKLRGKRNFNAQPFVVGLLNGLMPCGPLQSMQLLALASGNPFSGALSMFLFSLGTVPLMLGLGTLVSLLGKRFTHAVTNVGAVLVTVLGLAMISQGCNLSGITIGTPQNSSETEDSQASDVQIIDGVQVVKSSLLPGDYPTITVSAGMPVRWIIDAPYESINGCNYKVIIQEYGIEYSFHPGENIIEFTPETSGTFSYTCWMGMIKGNIFVTEEPIISDDLQVNGTQEENSQTEENSEQIPVISTGEYLVIPISEITSIATFYTFIVDGVQMEVFAIRASDGTIRTAFNTCQVCRGSTAAYYVQEDNYMVCQVCKSRFRADDVEILSGGCNPWPIFAEDKTITEDSILISYDFLSESTYIFEK